MSIYENFHVKGIFHRDKSNRTKFHACICLASLFFRYAGVCSARKEFICLQVILCFCLFLTQNMQEDSNKIKE